MKYLSSLLFLCIVQLAVYAQQSSTAYLEKVKVDFEENELITDEVIANNDILLIGETHGFQDNYKIAFKLISEYKRKTNFKYILAEMDWASAQRLNKLLEQKDTLAFVDLMNESKGSPAWCKERLDYYKKLLQLNEQYEQKIRYIGVDIPSGGIKLALEIIRDIQIKYEEDSAHLDSVITAEPSMNKALLSHLKQLQNTKINPNYQSQDAFEYQFHINNLLNYAKALQTDTEHEWNIVRDACMFENYKLLEQQYQLEGEKMIGVWGVTHTYQRTSEGVNWFASSMTNELGKKMHTYRIFCLDSKCMFPASWLPGFMKVFKSKKKLYYDLKLLNDDGMFTGKKAGLKEMAKTVTPHSIAVYDLTQQGSPYMQEPLLVSSSSKDWVTTQYFQTAIVVKNSAAAVPLGPNLK